MGESHSDYRPYRFDVLNLGLCFCVPRSQLTSLESSKGSPNGAQLITRSHGDASQMSCQPLYPYPYSIQSYHERAGQRGQTSSRETAEETLMDRF